MVIFKVLFKTLTVRFYINNAGSFLVIFYLAFMIMRGQEHVELAKSISTSLSLTLLTLILWGAYWLKVYAFIIKAIDLTPNYFLRQITLIRTNELVIYIFFILFFMGVPTWAYANFIAYFNVNYSTYGLLIIMLGFLLISNSLITLLLIKKIQQSIKEDKIGWYTKFINRHVIVPQSFWYLRYLFIKEPMLAFLSKTGSLILLSGTFYLFKTDVYDWRLLGVGVLLSFLLNSMIVYNFYVYTITNYWINNLPRKEKNIIISVLITIFTLFIPEVLFLAFHHQSSIQVIHWVGLIVLDFSLAYMLLISLFLKPLLKEEFGKRIFYLTIAMIFLILYSVPLIAISFLFLALGISVMLKYYSLLSNRF